MMEGTQKEGKLTDGHLKTLQLIELRTQGALHLPDVSTGVQKRCASTDCKYKSTVCCTKCNVYLCLVKNRNCFKEYHTK